MKLLITNSIRKSEFDVTSRIFSLEVIKSAAKKALLGLGITLKKSKQIPSSILKKLKITSSGGAGRVLFLLQINPEKALLVMLRPKNDKEIGENMAIENRKFKKLLDKNLALILHDIKEKNYDEYDLE